MNKPYKKGLVIGKFMPFHMGHELMIDFANDLCEEVIVLISGGDKIPIQTRHDWVSWTYSDKPSIRVVHMDEFDNIPEPQYDEDGTAIDQIFWDEWRIKLNHRFPDVDSVFTNDAYGKRLAKEIDADWVPVDPKRNTHNISGTMIRRNPNIYYNLLNKYAKEYYHKRVVVVGPESTGKSSLIFLLASIFGGQAIPEYGRTLSEIRDNDLNVNDFYSIVAGQKRTVEAGAKRNRLLFVDTEAYTTHLFAKIYLHSDEYNVHHRTNLFNEAWNQDFDLYILLAPTVEWKDDGTRVQPDQAERQKFFDDMYEYLVDTNRNYIIVDADNFKDRDRKAGHAVNELLHKH